MNLAPYQMKPVCYEPMFPSVYALPRGTAQLIHSAGCWIKRNFLSSHRGSIKKRTIKCVHGTTNRNHRPKILQNKLQVAQVILGLPPSFRLVLSGINPTGFSWRGRICWVWVCLGVFNERWSFGPRDYLSDPCKGSPLPRKQTRTTKALAQPQTSNSTRADFGTHILIQKAEARYANTLCLPSDFYLQFATTASLSTDIQNSKVEWAVLETSLVSQISRFLRNYVCITTFIITSSLCQQCRSPYCWKAPQYCEHQLLDLTSGQS